MALATFLGWGSYGRFRVFAADTPALLRADARGQRQASVQFGIGDQLFPRMDAGRVGNCSRLGSQARLCAAGDREPTTASQSSALRELWEVF
jgi:hypothetical protein